MNQNADSTVDLSSRCSAKMGIKMGIVKLLDCTLRDGGFVNNWNFGQDNIVSLFQRLVSAGIDIIEIGFLDEKHSFDIDRTIQPDQVSLERVYRNLDKGSSLIVGMIDYGTCPVSNLRPRAESYIDGIRVIFKKEKRKEAIEYCRQIKELGYIVFVQGVSITSYSDEELTDLIDMINELEPYAFSIVDTYGLLHKDMLNHYFEFSNRKLKNSIGIGYHSHNNFQLSYANCIELLESNIERELLLDGSLYGMGKSAGNTPLELLASYMNEHCGKKYKMYQILEAIDSTITDIFKHHPWGYSFKYFVSANQDCHPQYVSALMDKKKLSVKSIDAILTQLPKEKRLNFDIEIIENLYLEYQKIDCSDDDVYKRLEEILNQRYTLILGPGRTIDTKQQEIQEFIKTNNPVIISINYLPVNYLVDCVFVSNAKRYIQLSSKLNIYNCENSNNPLKVIATSNVTETKGTFDFMVRYGDLLDEDALMSDNSLIMLIKLLNQCGQRKVYLAGFDGYVAYGGANYIDPAMEYAFIRSNADAINADTQNSLKRLQDKMDIQFVTESRYEERSC